MHAAREGLARMSFGGMAILIAQIKIILTEKLNFRKKKCEEKILTELYMRVRLIKEKKFNFRKDYGCRFMQEI